MAEEMKKLVTDEENTKDPSSVIFKGTLMKWTNYIQGWQSRFVVSQNGNLSYYKSEEEQSFDCRGVLGLDKAIVKPHVHDECRFDVTIHDHTWYFRAPSVEARRKWVENLRAVKQKSQFQGPKYQNSEEKLSANLEDASSDSSSLLRSELKEQLAEIKTLNDIIKKQIFTLMEYFDLFARENWSIDSVKAKLSDFKLSMPDFKKDALTFKIASESIIKILNNCIDLLNRAEDVLKSETLSKIKISNKSLMALSPDQMEGPHSIIQQEEFFDALESGLERIEEEASLREILKRNCLVELPPSCSDARDHTLWPEIEKITEELIREAKADVDGWKILLDDGETKLLTEEMEVNGAARDRLRAFHTVRGATAREVCHFFFEPQYRQDWETTLEQMEVVERISEDVLVFHQVHRRVWPAAQRDSLFWSRLLDTGEGSWAVVNCSTSGPQYPERYKDCVRIKLTVCMLCHGVPAASRDDLICHVTYSSTVDPGGWAPAFALRTLMKKEYPKFLKRFSNYVVNQTKSKSVIEL